MKTLFSTLFFNLILFSTSAHADFSLLEKQISEREQPVVDLIDGAEQTIRWFKNNKQKTSYSLVYIHGFSASRQELSPTTELIADRLGANVFYTRLTGHGRSDDAMAEASIEDWKRDTLSAMRVAAQIGDNVILVGTSTGATLTTWLLTQPMDKQPMANIMISPNFGVKSTSAKVVTWPFGLTIAKWINGDYYSFIPANELHAKYWTERYPLDAVVPMLELVDEVVELDKSQITAPQLIIYSPQDSVVDVEAIHVTAKQFSSAKVSVVPFLESKDRVQHVLAGDACSPNSTTAMVELISRYIEQGMSLN